MGARDKLNIVTVWGCVIVSALLGAVMESWGAFWGTLVILIAGCHAAGGIRTRPDAIAPKPGRDGGRRPTARGRRA